MSDELGFWLDPIKPRPIPVSDELQATVLAEITSEPTDSEAIGERIAAVDAI